MNCDLIARHKAERVDLEHQLAIHNQTQRAALRARHTAELQQARIYTRQTRAQERAQDQQARAQAREQDRQERKQARQARDYERDQAFAIREAVKQEREDEAYRKIAREHAHIKAYRAAHRAAIIRDHADPAVQGRMLAAFDQRNDMEFAKLLRKWRRNPAYDGAYG